MALRNVYYVNDNGDVKSQKINVHWAYNNAKLTVQRLHQSFMKKHPNITPLEISSASSKPEGYWASATKMPIQYKGHNYTVEQVFQAGKIYNGHAMTGALAASNPKGYMKQHAQGKLQGFTAFGHKFGLKPTTAFYDWLYLQSLRNMKPMMKRLRQSRAFTDIFAAEGHPNTQAKACALFNSIVDKRGMDGFQKLMDNPKAFVQVDAMVNHDDLSKRIQAKVYQQNTPKATYKHYDSNYRFNKNPANNRIMQINALATRFYHHILMDTPEGAPARKYLEGRKITPETMNAYQLGFSPRGSKLKPYLKKHGVTDKMMKSAGLASTNDKTGEVYDKFFNRIMYPINNREGDAIAFSGRVLNKKEAMAKYLNVPETRIFHKSKTLFNLDKAHQSINKHDRVYLMEGYMDVISAHQAGVNNVIASMGTSLTKQQIGMIKGLTKNVTVCYDGDRPGQDAINRAMGMLKGTGINRSVVQMPEGIDPDEYRRKYGAKAFQNYMKTHIESPKSFQINYGFRTLNNSDLGNSQTQKYYDKLMPTIANAKSPRDAQMGVKMLSKLESNGKPLGMKEAQSQVKSYKQGINDRGKRQFNNERWQAGLRYYHDKIALVAQRDGSQLNANQVSADLVAIVNKYKKSGLTRPLYSMKDEVDKNKKVRGVRHKDDFPSHMDAIEDEYLAKTKGIQAVDAKYQRRVMISPVAKESHNMDEFTKNFNAMQNENPRAQYRKSLKQNAEINKQYAQNDKKGLAQDMKAQSEYLKQHPEFQSQMDNISSDTKPKTSKAPKPDKTPQDKYTMYCDGGCRNTGNQQKSGHVHSYDKSAYAFLITKNGQKLANGTNGFYGKTNNRMEIQAVISGLRTAYKLRLNKKPLRIVSDSKYVDNAINQHWLNNWAKNGFKRHGNATLSNADQWKTMYKALPYFNESFHWTKGHASGQTSDSRGNIYVDHLLNKTMDKLPDKGPNPGVATARSEQPVRPTGGQEPAHDTSRATEPSSSANSTDKTLDNFEDMKNEHVQSILDTYGIHNREKTLHTFESVQKLNPHDEQLNAHVDKLKALKGHKYISGDSKGRVHAVNDTEMKGIAAKVKPYTKGQATGQHSHVIKVDKSKINKLVAQESSKVHNQNKEIDNTQKGQTNKYKQLHREANQKTSPKVNRNRTRHQENGPDME